MKITQGGVRLRDWLRDERRTQKWLGDQIDTHQTNISRWILGLAPPPLAMALAVKKITGIALEDWDVPVSSTSVADAAEDVSHARAAG